MEKAVTVSELVNEIDRLERAKPSVDDDPYMLRAINEEITILIERMRGLKTKHQPRKGII